MEMTILQTMGRTMGSNGCCNERLMQGVDAGANKANPRARINVPGSQRRSP